MNERPLYDTWQLWSIRPRAGLAKRYSTVFLVWGWENIKSSVCSRRILDKLSTNQPKITLHGKSEQLHMQHHIREHFQSLVVLKPADYTHWKSRPTYEVQKDYSLLIAMGVILLQNVGGQLGVKPMLSSGRCRSDVLYTDSQSYF